LVKYNADNYTYHRGLQNSVLRINVAEWRDTGCGLPVHGKRGRQLVRFVFSCVCTRGARIFWCRFVNDLPVVCVLIYAHTLIHHHHHHGLRLGDPPRVEDSNGAPWHGARIPSVECHVPEGPCHRAHFPRLFWPSRAISRLCRRLFTPSDFSRHTC